MTKYQLLTVLLLLFCLTPVRAEDGSRLWLRADASAQAKVTANKKSPTIDIAIKELQTNWHGDKVNLVIPAKAGIPSSAGLTKEGMTGEGYSITGDAKKGITISAFSEQGLLYGAYHLLRLQETGRVEYPLNIQESPQYNLRILNHWDNLDGTVERGYAGHSIWKWDELPNTISPRYKEYARANASIGINATVLNNVNASPKILTAELLEKVKAIANELRPYGIKVYLSVNFSSPAILDGLKTSDPLDKDVQGWWKNKVKEIYRIIPDFGGFLVKANSEGQPGPQDFGRTHADGANMLADALKPYHGIVMWRAFVYSPSNEDRAKQAYLEFMPLDGQFRDNVIIQVKNGPIDFQPREPFSPLFGAMKHTGVMAEVQVTQEYLGHSNHLAFLAPMWQEFLESDTYANGKGSFVANTISAIAGVSNIGDDINWTGSHLAQANWYAFGRLAWNPQLSSEQIADEWIRQTFSQDESFVEPVKTMMLNSWEAVVNYMMPLGLHHIFAVGHHYGPEPWGIIPGGRPDWQPWYFHNADTIGLGFDRSSTGSNAVSQYFSPLKEEFNDINTCPPPFLLWFHHVPWQYKLQNGRSLWDELCYHYDLGVQQVRDFQKVWDKQESYVDAERFQHVQSRLKIQARDAQWWKDACLLYFQEFSKQPVPYDIERPVNDLEQLKQVRLNISNYENASR
ncbi:MAG: alpha-glucuronidase [Candidatus Symbiothrix sp.]|jgi:alpha-glucuronidase|nr:alpha-glucuronidase [Candidatus Symbiothrix sp.]